MAEDEADPEMMQQYLDYKILDPSRTSVHMQAPLLDPYTYRQVGKNTNTVKNVQKMFLLVQFLLLPEEGDRGSPLRV